MERRRDGSDVTPGQEPASEGGGVRPSARLELRKPVEQDQAHGQDAGRPADGHGETLRPSQRLERRTQTEGPSESREVSRAEMESKLAQLPTRVEGDKTHGIPVLEGKEHPAIASGRDGPSQSIPRGTDGFNGNCKTHVEAHTAALMRQTDAREGVLFINNEPCQTPVGCDRNLPGMLPEGATLRVIGPNGFDKTYVGQPDKKR